MNMESVLNFQPDFLKISLEISGKNFKTLQCSGKIGTYRKLTHNISLPKMGKFFLGLAD